jgi:hypothetical protein
LSFAGASDVYLAVFQCSGDYKTHEMQDLFLKTSLSVGENRHHTQSTHENFKAYALYQILDYEFTRCLETIKLHQCNNRQLLIQSTLMT